MPKLKLTKPKAIHFRPTERTEVVLESIQRKSRILRGPFAAVALDYVAAQMQSGHLVFVEHQLQPSK